MEIYLNQGIGEIHFGMSPAEVRSIMGDKETFESWMGGNLNESLVYPGLVFHFDRCNANGPLDDARLESIWIGQNCPALLDGQLLFDMNLKQLKDWATKHGVNHSSKAYPNSNDIDIEIEFDNYALELSIDTDSDKINCYAVIER